MTDDDQRHRLALADVDRRDIKTLLDIMAALRDRETGCPWDVKQTYSTIAPYTLEEAYEVVDAIERADLNDLRDELGDLLLQVVFHAQMASEDGSFDFSDVVKAINDKMIRRHPHVFGNAEERKIPPKKRFWEDLKETEKTNANVPSGPLDVPTTLPAMSRAQKIQKKAARIGFDWPDFKGVMDKMDEELCELRDAIEGRNEDQIADELGDILFTAVNLARHKGHDAESLLRAANSKFVKRFEKMVQQLEDKPEKTDLETLELAWQRAKGA